MKNIKYDLKYGCLVTYRWYEFNCRNCKLTLVLQKQGGPPEKCQDCGSGALTIMGIWRE